MSNPLRLHRRETPGGPDKAAQKAISAIRTGTTLSSLSFRNLLKITPKPAKTIRKFGNYIVSKFNLPTISITTASLLLMLGVGASGQSPAPSQSNLALNPPGIGITADGEKKDGDKKTSTALTPDKDPKGNVTAKTTGTGPNTESLWVGKQIFSSLEIVDGTLKIENLNIDDISTSLNSKNAKCAKTIKNLKFSEIKKIITPESGKNFQIIYMLIENDEVGSAILGIGFYLDEIRKGMNSKSSSDGIGETPLFKMTDGSKILKNTMLEINGVICAASPSAYLCGRGGEYGSWTFRNALKKPDFPDLVNPTTSIENGHYFVIKSITLNNYFKTPAKAYVDMKDLGIGVVEENDALTSTR